MRCKTTGEQPEMQVKVLLEQAILPECCAVVARLVWDQ